MNESINQSMNQSINESINLCLLNGMHKMIRAGTDAIVI